MNIFSLSGKTIILTGATGYFGRYFAQGLLDFDAKVILIGRNAKKLKQLENELCSKYKSDSISSYVVDQYDHQSAQKMFMTIANQERINVLINNAFDLSLRTGFNHPSGKLASSTYNQWQSSFDSGIYWAVQATQVFGSAMQKKGSGAIINVCSMYSIVSPHPALYTETDKFNPPGYSMAKAGLLQFTKYSATFLAPQVRVNAISPGSYPDTETLSYNAVSKKDTDFMKRLADRTLLGRVGHPHDLIGGLVYLASDASTYMTGQNLIIDGGWTVT